MGAGAGSAGEADEAGVTSIHELVAVKEPGLAERLRLDWHERRSGLVHVFPADTDHEAFASATAAELGDFVEGAFEVLELTAERLVVAHDGTVRAGGRDIPVRVEKGLLLEGGRLDPALVLDVAVENRGDEPIDALLGVEWALHLLGGGGNPAAWWEVDGRRTTHDVTGTADGAAEIMSGNDHVGLVLATTTEPAATAWWAPIETISNSEAGFERIYQGSALLLSWPLRLGPGGRTAVRVRQALSVARDRAAEEAAAAP